MTHAELFEKALEALDELAAIPALRGPEMEALKAQLEAPGMTPLKSLVLGIYARCMLDACSKVSEQIGVEVRPLQLTESGNLELRNSGKEEE